MAITAAEIFQNVLDQIQPFGASVASITPELKGILIDLSGKGDFIDMEDSVTTADGVAYVDVAAKRIKNIMDAYIPGDYHLSPGCMEDYLETIENQDTPTEGKPRKYFFFKDKLWVYDPIPDDAYTVHLKGYKYHADTTTTIEFSDRYRIAIGHGVLGELWAGKLAKIPGAANEMVKHKGIYAGEIEGFRGNVIHGPIFIKFHDV